MHENLLVFGIRHEIIYYFTKVSDVVNHDDVMREANRLHHHLKYRVSHET